METYFDEFSIGDCKQELTIKANKLGNPVMEIVNREEGSLQELSRSKFEILTIADTAKFMNCFLNIHTVWTKKIRQTVPESQEQFPLFKISRKSFHEVKEP